MQPGSGVNFTRGPSGTVVKSTAQTIKRRTLPQPSFTLYDAGPNSGNPQLGITNGIVNGHGFAGLAAGMTAGGDPPYVQPVASSDQYDRIRSGLGHI